MKPTIETQTDADKYKTSDEKLAKQLDKILEKIKTAIDRIKRKASREHVEGPTG